MIAGVSYNLFNGEEHLLHSLRAIRPCVEYVNIIVQPVSNHGEPAAPSLWDALHAAVTEGLIDDVWHYEPDLQMSPSLNEHAKRQFGLTLAKRAGVSHFMTMDADEYYVGGEFLAAKTYIEENNVATSAVATYLHIKRPVWRSRTPDTTCCAFLTKVTAESEIEYAGSFPVLVDPTRRLHGSHTPFHFFDPEDISMRHMNLVRLDGLVSKLRNSSSAHMTDFMGRVRAVYDGWEFGQQLEFPNKPPMDIVEVSDIFGIDPIFSVRRAA